MSNPMTVADEAAHSPENDTIVVTIPATGSFRGIATLVLGGVGSRLDLPYERMDDLQLALLSVLDASHGDETTVEIRAEDRRLAVSVGPLEPGVAQDGGLGLVLSKLTDGVELGLRGSDAWVTFYLERLAPGSTDPPSG